MQLVAELPPAHRLVFEYLMRFLDAILERSDQNNVVPDHLCQYDCVCVSE